MAKSEKVSQGFFNDVVFGRTRNQEILQEKQHTQKCIYELPREKSRIVPWVPHMNLTVFYLRTLSGEQLHPDLHRTRTNSSTNTDSDADTEAETETETDADTNTNNYTKDVYMVTKVSSTHKALPRSLWHWSLYCDGHYYHLSKAHKTQGARTILVDDPVGERTDAERDPETDETGKKKALLLAYHMGSTTYTTPQIKQIAVWLITQMQSYDLFHQNCQHFVLGLCMRVISGGRTTTVLMGRPEQLHRLAVALEKSSDEKNQDTISQSYNTGFVLTAPNANVSNVVAGWWFSSGVAWDANMLRATWLLGEEGGFPGDVMAYGRFRRRFVLPFAAVSEWAVMRRAAWWLCSI